MVEYPDLVDSLVKLRNNKYLCMQRLLIVALIVLATYILSLRPKPPVETNKYIPKFTKDQCAMYANLKTPTLSKSLTIYIRYVGPTEYIAEKYQLIGDSFHDIDLTYYPHKSVPIKEIDSRFVRIKCPQDKN
jgi:hypothetical protein